MTVTEVYDDDPDGGEGLIARVFCPEEGLPPPHGTTFYSAAGDPQQVGLIVRDADETIPPHAHHYHRRTFDRTQEVLIVLSGGIEVSLYTSAGKHLRKLLLHGGEVICLVAGGHGIRFLKHTKMLEVKTGPYAGKSVDKYSLPVNS